MKRIMIFLFVVVLILGFRAVWAVEPGYSDLSKVTKGALWAKHPEAKKVYDGQFPSGVAEVKVLQKPYFLKFVDGENNPNDKNYIVIPIGEKIYRNINESFPRLAYCGNGIQDTVPVRDFVEIVKIDTIKMYFTETNTIIKTDTVKEIKYVPVEYVQEPAYSDVIIQEIRPRQESFYYYDTCPVSVRISFWNQSRGCFSNTQVMPCSAGGVYNSTYITQNITNIDDHSVNIRDSYNRSYLLSKPTQQNHASGSSSGRGGNNASAGGGRGDENNNASDSNGRGDYIGGNTDNNPNTGGSGGREKSGTIRPSDSRNSSSSNRTETGSNTRIPSVDERTQNKSGSTSQTRTTTPRNSDDSSGKNSFSNERTQTTKSETTTKTRIENSGYARPSKTGQNSNPNLERNSPVKKNYTRQENSSSGWQQQRQHVARNETPTTHPVFKPKGNGGGQSYRSGGSGNFRSGGGSAPRSNGGGNRSGGSSSGRR